MPYIQTADGQVLQADPAEIIDNLGKGQWYNAPGAMVRMRNATGDIKSIPFTPEAVGEALTKHGFTFETAEQEHKTIVKERYGDQEGGAFLDGVLRAASFGLSDPIRVGLGISTAADLKGRREANPNSELAGNIAGIVVPGAALKLTSKAIGAGKALTEGVGLGAEEVAGLATRAGEQGISQAIKQIPSRGMARKFFENTPTNWLSRQTGNLEKTISKALPQGESWLGRAANKMVSRGVSGAAEGAIYGVGQNITDATLHNEPLTAESMLEYGGMGALFGGGLAAGTTAIGEIAGGLKRGIKKTAEAVTGGAETQATAKETLFKSEADFADQYLADLQNQQKILSDIEARTPGAVKTTADKFTLVDADQMSKEWAASPIEGKIAKGYSKVAGAVTGGSKDDIAKLLSSGETGKALREAALKPEVFRDNVARSLAENENKLGAIFDKESPMFTGMQKEENVAKIWDSAKAVESNQMYSEINKELKRIEDTVSGMLASSPAEFGYRNQLKQLNQRLDVAEKNISGIFLEPNATNAGPRAFIEMDKLKRDIGKMRESMRKGVQVSADQATAKAFEDLYGIVRKDTAGKPIEEVNGIMQFLEREDLWNNAARAQKIVNDQWETLLGNEAYHNKFSVKTGEQNWKPIYEADPGKFRSFVEGLGTPKSDLDMKYLVKRNQYRIQLLDEASRSYDILNNPELQTMHAEALGLAKKQLKSIYEAAGAVRWQNKFGALGGTSKTANTLLGMLGLGAFGLKGLSVLALNPQNLIKAMAAFDKISAGKGIAGSLLKAVNETRKVTETTISEILNKAGPIAIKVEMKDRYRHPKEREVLDLLSNGKVDEQLLGFHKLKSELEQSVQTGSLYQHIDQATANVQKQYPTLGLGVKLTTSRIANYLLANAPRSPAKFDPMSAIDVGKPWIPNAQVRDWLQTYHLATHPMEILDKLGANTLTPRDVKTVSTCWPELYAQITQTAMQELNKINTAVKDKKGKQQPISYQRKQQLNILCGLAGADNIAKMQELYAGRTYEDFASKKPIQLKGQMGNDMLSGSQRLLSNKQSGR